MQVMEVQHYLLCQCGTTSITYAVLLLFFFLLLLTLPDPSQVAMVEAGRMVVSGRLAVLAICADPDGVVSAFRDRLD